MPSDDSSEWTELQGTCLKQLLWKPGDKWYDCNKRTNQSANYGDQNLCWAATASNMIHWWFDRNKDLVGEYCATNGIPSLYKNDKESEVFQVFKDSFTDHGSYTEQGLNWFFLGKYNQSGDMAGIKKHDTGSYFSKVLSTVSNMTENTQLGSLAAFDNALKSAFKNKQAIGFSDRKSVV